MVAKTSCIFVPLDKQIITVNGVQAVSVKVSIEVSIRFVLAHGSHHSYEQLLQVGRERQMMYLREIFSGILIRLSIGTQYM